MQETTTLPHFMTSFQISGRINSLVHGVHFNRTSDIGSTMSGDPVLVGMTPLIFLTLVPPLEYPDLEWLEQQIFAKASIQPPFLKIDPYPDQMDDGGYPKVLAHDGRHRMSILAVTNPGTEFPVFLYGIPSEAEFITRTRTAMWSQDDFGESVLIPGPIFSHACILGRIFDDLPLDDLYPFLGD